jgi:ribosome recycling factor
MKITKRQLRKIIKEEKQKLLKEMNRDGTISDDEGLDREDLLATVELQLNELIDHVISESERIGGGFRGPGIKRDAFSMMADMIHSYKR